MIRGGRCNSTLEWIQAAILSVKLKYLDKWIQERNRVADYYLQNLRSVHVKLPQLMENVTHAFHLFVAKVEKREQLMALLKSKGISTGIHYPIPLPAASCN